MTGRFVLAAVAVLFAHGAPAQEIRPLDERVSNAPGYYFHVLPGEVSTEVTLIGTVARPGYYTVSDGMNLGEVLALAGGPLLAPENSEIERTVTIRMYRGRGVRELAYEASLEAFAQDATAYPRLVDGDFIEVTTINKRRRTYLDTLTVVGGISTAIIAVVQIITILR